MAIEYGPIEQYCTTWGSNVIPDQAGRPAQQYVFPVAFAEACPVPNKVIKRNGAQAAIDRYKRLIKARLVALETVDTVNPYLARRLTLTRKRNFDEPIGAHEPTAVPFEHLSEIVWNNTPPGYGLPRVALLRLDGTPETQKHTLALVSNAALRADTPLELLALTGEFLTDAHVPAIDVLHAIASKGYMAEENVARLFGQLHTELLEHAPQLWATYSGMTQEERAQAGIYSFPQ